MPAFAMKKSVDCCSQLVTVPSEYIRFQSCDENIFCALNDSLMSAIGGGPWAAPVGKDLRTLGIELIDLAAGTAYETPLTTVLVNQCGATRTIGRIQAYGLEGQAVRVDRAVALLHEQRILRRHAVEFLQRKAARRIGKLPLRPAALDHDPVAGLESRRLRG